MGRELDVRPVVRAVAGEILHRMTTRRLALTLLLAAAAVMPAAAGAAPAGQAAQAKDPAAVPLARAAEMAEVWGRCETARSAHRLLTIAERTSAARPRVTRARAAVIAWRTVERECSKPFNGPRVWVG